MANGIRWGLLSTARINRALIPPIKSLPRHSLRAVASRDAARAKAYAAEWDIPVAYGSYEALLADPEIDAIYNPLPNGLHAEWTIRAAQAGKHVLCEKPLALSLDEVDRIAECGGRQRRRRDRSVHVSSPPADDAAEGAARTAAPSVTSLVIRGAFTFTLTRPGDVRLDTGDGRRQPLGRRVLPGQHGALPGRPRTCRALSAGSVRRRRGSTMCSSACWISTVRSRSSTAALPRHSGPTWRLSERRAPSQCPCPSSPARTSNSSSRVDREREVVPVEGQALYEGEVEDMANAILHGTAPRVSLADSRGNTATLARAVTNPHVRASRSVFGNGYSGFLA